MFGIKTARIMQLEHKVKVLESNIQAVETQRDRITGDRDMLKRGLNRRDQRIAELEKELANPFRTEPHQHDFAALEERVLANMLMQGDTYFGEGFVRGRWRSSYASLQNLPRRQPPKLIGLTIEHNGKAYRWVVGDKGIAGLKTSPGYKDNSKLKVFVYFEGGNFSTTTFDKNLFTQPVTYLWEEQ